MVAVDKASVFLHFADKKPTAQGTKFREGLDPKCAPRALSSVLERCLFSAVNEVLRFSGEAFKVDGGFPFPGACDDGNLCFPNVKPQKNGEITMPDPYPGLLRGYLSECF